ncbi:MAG: LytTR family transcriptional regulator DNA-binding domain-containing protein [Roseibium sp.]|nr:LytTR family transcriptional regulator DNA-binding domain-containing protein [Roseibium sp.]
MSVSHEPWLVALSLIVSFQGSYVGLQLVARLADAPEHLRRMLLAGSAITLALGIWSMHFVGMLAAQLPVPANFLVLPTLLSFLICVLVVGVAVFAASNGLLTSVRLGLAALVMGSGISIMHYLGMYALHESLHMSHDLIYVFASFLISINAAGLALWLVFGAGRRPPVVISAVVLALAIASMHYTAMAGLQVMPVGPADVTAPAVSPGILAIVVAIVAFVVSGLFLLALVPDQSGQRDVETPSGRTGDLNRWQVAQDILARSDEEPKSGAGAAGAGGAPAGPSSPAVAGDKRPAGLQAAPGERSAGRSAELRTLPIERDGTKGHVPAHEIVAIQADAHYTRVYDGTRALFCPLAISEAERRLDPKLFTRVHRSHIVNLARVSGYKRSGDGGLLTMEGTMAHAVPVSRSRWARVKARLAEARAGTVDPALTIAAQ